MIGNFYQKLKNYIFGNSKERSYIAAKATGPNQLWTPKSTSAYTEIQNDARKVRDRARDLERNNPYIAGAVKKFICYVVGEGMKPQAKVRLSSGEGLNKPLNDQIENAWERWSEHCGVNGDSMSDIQAQVVRHLLIDGEILIHKVVLPNGRLALQALESDYLVDHIDGPRENGNFAKGGIEYNSFGQPVYYHIYSGHPGDTTSDVTELRVPASSILHIFERQRASQHRGICHFASIVADIFDLNEYTGATMELARIATAFGIFVQSAAPESLFMPSVSTSEDTKNRQSYINPAGIHYLLPGETVETVKAEQPGAVYKDFVQTRLKSASSGMGQSYETFSNDYSQSTYSSARQAMLQERALFRMFSSLLDRQLNIPVFRDWMDMSVLNGDINLPGYESNRIENQRVKFSRPRFEWIDPLKEANASVVEIELGINTRTSILENRGEDFNETIETLAAERELLQAKGLLKDDVALKNEAQEDKSKDAESE